MDDKKIDEVINMQNHRQESVETETAHTPQFAPDTPPNQPIPVPRMVDQPTNENLTEIDTQQNFDELNTTTDSSWKYHHDTILQSNEFDNVNQITKIPDMAKPFAWTAFEFIAHDKTPAWYVILATIGLFGAVAIWLLTKDFISTIVIIFSFIVIGFYAGRKPRLIKFELNKNYIRVAEKSYSLRDFRSLSINDESTVVSLVFLPFKRFIPPLTVYVTRENEDSILNLLSQILPIEPHRQDAIDALLKRIRF